MFSLPPFAENIQRIQWEQRYSSDQKHPRIHDVIHNLKTMAVAATPKAPRSEQEIALDSAGRKLCYL